ncbi:hypothetical protein T4D_10546 [Trichinella pseudospiralis]|uniref:Uncharacterized protein n=1 Tax=Trichinella pseudospiralis TaxID=6337 RepID=A0A0V1FF05_TRIPS|nr:hypothetical protein T4D_10546 [Trichinella pseudospiralis]
MEVKYDFNGGEWKGNQICNLEMYWQEVILLTMSFMYYNSSSQDRGNAKSASFVIAITAFASSVFNREHYRQERHALKITDFFLGLNKNLCFITSASTDIPIYVDSKIDINRILSTENGIR